MIKLEGHVKRVGREVLDKWMLRGSFFSKIYDFIATLPITLLKMFDTSILFLLILQKKLKAHLQWNTSDWYWKKVFKLICLLSQSSGDCKK